jgi:hypothetical protein
MMTAEIPPIAPTCERRVQAVLALFRGASVAKVVTQYQMGRSGFVKLLRPRLSLGKRVPLLSPTHLLGSPLRARNFGPTLESIPHLFAVLRC